MDSKRFVLFLQLQMIRLSIVRIVTGFSIPGKFEIFHGSDLYNWYQQCSIKYLLNFLVLGKYKI